MHIHDCSIFRKINGKRRRIKIGTNLSPQQLKVMGQSLSALAFNFLIYHWRDLLSANEKPNSVIFEQIRIAKQMLWYSAGRWTKYEYLLPC
jgi:hypothetical protein